MHLFLKANAIVCVFQQEWLIFATPASSKCWYSNKSTRAARFFWKADRENGVTSDL